jgi:hypothetical protein
MDYLIKNRLISILYQVEYVLNNPREYAPETLERLADDLNDAMDNAEQLPEEDEDE